MILYLHGFASCGDSTKTRLLKQHFGQESVVAPDLPIAPDEAIAYIETLLKEKRIEMVIGSSLGGFYATYFCEKYALKTVLINPSTEPFMTLQPYIGLNTYWCSGKPFEWKAEYLEDLKSYAITELQRLEKYLLLLQKGDELLDYRLAQKRYGGATMIIQEGGNHRFENIDAYLDTIESFLRKG